MKEDSDVIHSYNHLTKIVEQLPFAKTFSTFVYNAFMDIINFDLGFEHAMLRMQKEQLGSTEESIVWDKLNWVKATKDRMSELMFVDRMIHISGLECFREEIMTMFIEGYFKKGNAKEQFNDLLTNLSKKKAEK